jgi:GABA permease
VDTGQAEREGAAFVWEATTKAAQQRLDDTLDALRGDGLTVTGELGDYRPLVALDKAMREFRPDHVVISTHPEDRSTWLRHGVVDDARERYDVPVQHVVVEPVLTR